MFGLRRQTNRGGRLRVQALRSSCVALLRQVHRGFPAFVPDVFFNHTRVHTQTQQRFQRVCPPCPTPPALPHLKGFF